MNRLDQQKQFIKKPIPALSESGFAPRPEPELPPQGNSNWLSSAMAIWIAQDELPPAIGLRQDAAPTAR